MESNEYTFTNEWADPFVDTMFDSEVQTGADWYRLALSASLGGKPIHGANLTPSCELISKVDENYASKYCTGRIKLNDREKEVPALGPDVTERPYMGRDFKGVKSAPGAFFAFDQGIWEPSKRLRARESALLAASIASHTGDADGAIEIVSKITSDVIDAEAVEVASIPVSHMKRDVITVSKPAHRVFSCGTIQKALVWEDSSLAAEKLPDVAALDWARVTTVARYIGEINSQVCTTFRRYARNIGVPFALVKGCWAYVSYGDFVLEPGAFTDVPVLDLTKYKVPSLQDAYKHSAESMIKHCHVNLNKLSYSEGATEANVLLKVLEECHWKFRGKIKFRDNWADTDILSAPTGHAFDAGAAAKATAASSTAFNALLDVTAVLINSNQDYKEDSRRVAASARLGEVDYEATDRLTSNVLTHDIWLQCRALLAEKLGNLGTAHSRVAKLKRTTFKTSAGLEVNMRINASMKENARSTTIGIAKNAVIVPAPELPKFNLFTSLRAMQGSVAIQATTKHVINHLDEFRTKWADRYDSWAKSFAVLDHPEAKRMSICYGTAGSCFRMLTPPLAIALSSRFIDGGAPRASYLYKSAENYCRKRTIPPPNLRLTQYASAAELAEELDQVLTPEIAFVEVEDFVFEKASMLAADFGVGGNDALEAEEMEAEDRLANMQLPRTMAGGVSVAVSAEKLAAVEAVMAAMATRSVRKATYHEVLSSYEDINVAEIHANAHGYDSFAMAYNELGDGARFDTESEYTRVGQSAAYKSHPVSDDWDVLA